MARIGLKFPVVSLIKGYDDTGYPIYGDGFIVGKAVSAEKSIESNDNALYGDDSIAENDAGFASGTIKLGVADFGDDYFDGLRIQAAMLGHSLKNNTIYRSANDVAPYVGFGYYKTKKQNNLLRYETTWLLKCVFKVPSESTNTKGKSIEWQTPEIEGTFMAVDCLSSIPYEETSVFVTEQEARSWLINKSKCEPLGNMTLLSNLISEYNALDPETYTSTSWGNFYANLSDVSKTVRSKSYMGTKEVAFWQKNLQDSRSALIERSA